MTTSQRRTRPETTVAEPAEQQSDLELVEAAIEALTGALPVALSPTQGLAAARRLVGTVVRQPRALTKRGVDLTAQLARIAAGTSDIAPDRKDARWKDPAWQTNPLYKRVGQSYLAWNRAVHGVVEDLDLDEKSKLRALFLLKLVTEAVAPTNTLVGNPAALKRARETRGRSLVDGARHALYDVRNNGAMPSMVDSRPFVIGETIAATPGAVVWKNEIAELIQYSPSTGKVRERPMLVMPPQINKYYVLDLAPGRSMVEHLVSHGHQVFMLSWANPGKGDAAWDYDSYARTALEASDVVREITGSSDMNLLGVCAGGITAAGLLGHLATAGDDRFASVTFLVTLIDFEVPSQVGTFISRPVVAAASRKSRSEGVLSGRELARVFAWLRPNDLVWNYWVNNYLMGKNPPAFDVLAWNADAVDLPASLHGDFMDMAQSNSLTHPGELRVLGTGVDLGKVTVDSYVVGAVTDHICPWRACYPVVDLMGGSVEFVLSSQGHIQALINPSGNPKGSYRTTDGDDPARGADDSAGKPTADEWLERATEHPGSWWDHWVEWLEPRSGAEKNARRKLGSKAHPPIEDAPGSYVRATV